LADHFVFIRAAEVPQEPFAGFRINERRKRTSFCAPPGVQLDQMVTVINASLERWRVLHLPLTAVYVTRRKAVLLGDLIALVGWGTVRIDDFERLGLDCQISHAGSITATERKDSRLPDKSSYIPHDVPGSCCAPRSSGVVGVLEACASGMCCASNSMFTQR
jgi:hypothetical protein